MFGITIGQVFELSIARDFLLRVGGLEFYWARDFGFTVERVEGSRGMD